MQWTRHFQLLLALFALNFDLAKDLEKNLLKCGYAIPRSTKLTYIRDIAHLRAKTWLWYQQSGEHGAGQALIVSRISLFDQF